jgi:DNA repair protein RecN (Recombination protein N)
MLKQLHIKNIILIESAEIDFQKGFNVLSGETGSGKSAIIEALSLILGERADTGLVRHGTEKGIIEARFDIELLPELFSILSDAGIDHCHDEDLVIRREISSSGKSRAFLNNQMAHIGLLRRIGSHLVRMADQHANQKLQSSDYHRTLLDLYGKLELEVDALGSCWENENKIRQEIEKIIKNEDLRRREIKMLQKDLEELLEANLKENEEEDLFIEYTFLTNIEELKNKSFEVLNSLQSERQGILPTLSKQQSTLEQLLQVDFKLSDIAESFRNALLELKEIAYSLQRYTSNLESNPSRIMEVNERLEIINKLKRKHGVSVAEMISHKSKIESKLNLLENIEDSIELLKKELKTVSEANEALCSELTQKRTQAAKMLEKAMNEQLCSLNMSKTEFQVKVLQQSRNHHGEDFIEFYFAPNVGECLISIKDCASGGELSRLMLSLQTLLAGKEKMPTLVFDEIDANIGGATASVIGKKLKEIGLNHQILCITHFPQVAKYAEHHFEISKQEKSGRTLTFINVLDDTSKSKELARMQGSIPSMPEAS